MPHHKPNAIHLRRTHALMDLYDRSGRVVAQTKIDKRDVEKVLGLHRRWYLAYPGRAHRYVMANVGGRATARLVQLHRFLLDATGEQVDHVNGDTLDNRRSNLVDGSAGWNRFNLRSAHRDSTTGHLGVHYAKHAKAYRVRFYYQGKCYYYGYHKKKADAVRIAREERQKVAEAGLHQLAAK